MKKTYILLSFFLLVTNFKAFSQQSLSLSDAIQIGLENNYGIQIEGKKINISRNNNNWGQAGAYPSIQLVVNQSNNRTFDSGGPLSFIRNDTSYFSSGANPAINLSWTFFNGFKVKMEKRKLEQLQRETEGNASIVISNTIQSIILGYYQGVLQKERLEILNKNLSLSRDKYEYLKIKQSLGSSATSELLLEEGNYLNDSTNVLNQEIAYRDAIRNLNLLLGIKDTDTPLQLTDRMEFEALNYDLDELSTKMLQDNIDLKKTYISQEILKKEVRLSKVQKYPTISLEASQFLNQNNLYRIDTPGRIATFTSTTALNFRLSFNLFNGGRIKRAIKNAALQEEIGKIGIDQLKNSLNKDLHSTYDLFKTRRNLYGISQRKKDVASLNLSISEDKFKNGSINSFDYRNIQLNSLLAEFDALQAVYNLMEAKISLMRLTGGIIETYTHE
ncbi:TolC family protein [Xanthovirga aplysinae]|uniref:TolC family protein n=1 Tax=Xanthovirga aplysinae TaxID=2529853 RepID=UPI0012BD4532|nr:TolC family protein [Xanthovirga aplysinae]MTI32454.1 TolC family protein [Xanthovirga aplysinae]